MSYEFTKETYEEAQLLRRVELTISFVDMVKSSGLKIPRLYEMISCNEKECMVCDGIIEYVLDELMKKESGPLESLSI